MGKALKTAGAIIGGAVLLATGVGAIAGLQVTAMGIAGIGSTSIANLQLVSAGLTAVGSMLDKPQSQAAAQPTQATANGDQPIPFLFGRMGVAGKIVHRDEFGPDNMYQAIIGVVSGAGPIKGFVGYKGDDQAVTFDPLSGIATSSQWTGEMWMRYRLGAQPDTALPSPTGLKNNAALPSWGAAHRLSGRACFLQVLGENSKGTAYPGGVPDSLHTCEGVYGYDLRFDDTYPGGAGTCRLNDRTTWRYIQNPIIAALNWALGMKENGKVIGGLGVSIAGLDLPAFVEAANIADANAWKIAGWPDTSEDAFEVFKQMLQAGGASYSRLSGKMSCVSRGAPKASIVTITRRDTAGPFDMDTGSSLYNRINTLTPRFMSEAAGWQMTQTEPVAFDALIAEDGGVRSDGVDYRFVPAAKQAGQLAAFDILDAREPFAGTIPLKPHMRRLKPGDCFDIDEPGFLLDGVKCIVISRGYDTSQGQVRIAFRSETDGKHDLALGKTTTLPEFPVLTPPDPTYVTPPLPIDWTVTVPGPAPDGSQLPNIDLTGLVSNDTVDALLISWRAVASGENPNTPPLYLDLDGNVLPGWMDAGSYAPTIRSLTIQGPKSGAVVWLALRYRRGSNFSAAELKGPITVRTLVADVMPNAPGLSQIKSDIEAAFGDIFDVSALVSQARTDIDAQGTEIAAARGGQPNLNSRIAQVNQARIDGDTSNAQAIALVQARTANTEADIIDIENALATESGARAQAISEVSAKLSAPPNEYANADLSNGTFGFTPIWGFGGPLPTISVTGAGEAIRFLKTGGQFDGSVTRYGIMAMDGGGVSKSAGGAPARNMWPVTAGERIAFAIDARTRSGSARWYMDVRWCNKDGGGSTSLGGAETTHGNTTYTRIGVVNDVPGDGFVWVEMTAVLGWDGSLGVADMELRRPTFARLATTATTLPAYTAPAGGRQIQALNSSVTQNALAITDLENQQALASWSVIANASGGKPARIGLTSSSLGSFVALDAPFIFWGDNTVFDDATDTLQTTVGPNIRVLAFGAPFGASENLLEWWGPSSIAIGSMTTANGLNGRMTTTPYVFDTVTANQAPRVASVPIDGRIGYNQALNTAALTAALAVPAFGKFVLSVQLFSTSDNDGSVISATGTASLKRLNGASETTLVSGVNVSGQTVDPAAKNTSALNVTVANSFAGNVTFRLDVQGGGGPSTSHGTVQGTLTVTWYPI